MTYAVATTAHVHDDLMSFIDVDGVSPECIEQFIRAYERELAADADRLYAVGRADSPAHCFRIEYPVPDGLVQRVFRIVVSTESAGAGIVRVVYVEHETVGDPPRE